MEYSQIYSKSTSQNNFFFSFFREQPDTLLLLVYKFCFNERVRGQIKHICNFQKAEFCDCSFTKKKKSFYQIDNIKKY